ncbi:hypothetical protein M1N80_04405 [Peptococcaceae bacterium]|nr:hypothetical protein [Peptococcaceae bacterium]
MPKEKFKDKINSENKIKNKKNLLDIIVEIPDYIILVVIVIAVSVPVLLQFLTKETLLFIIDVLFLIAFVFIAVILGIGIGGLILCCLYGSDLINQARPDSRTYKNMYKKFLLFFIGINIASIVLDQLATRKLFNAFDINFNILQFDTTKVEYCFSFSLFISLIVCVVMYTVIDEYIFKRKQKASTRSN